MRRGTLIQACGCAVERHVHQVGQYSPIPTAHSKHAPSYSSTNLCSSSKMGYACCQCELLVQGLCRTIGALLWHHHTHTSTWTSGWLSDRALQMPLCLHWLMHEQSQYFQWGRMPNHSMKITSRCSSKGLGPNSVDYTCCRGSSLATHQIQPTPTPQLMNSLCESRSCRPSRRCRAIGRQRLWRYFCRNLGFAHGKWFIHSYNCYNIGTSWTQDPTLAQIVQMSYKNLDAFSPAECQPSYRNHWKWADSVAT